MSKQLDLFKEALKNDPSLMVEVKKSTLQGIVTLAKAKGFDISADDIEAAVAVKGGSGSADAVVLWENYVVVGS